MSTSSLHFTGPIRHENLEIHFLIGPSVPPDYLTLAEGCSMQVVEVFETGRVGRLAVWNKSADRPLFIQVGELLKGGLQDRTVATDLVLDPGEKYDAVQSYCVERERWSKRQAEDHTKFTPSQEFVSTKPLRKSVERRADQAEVWTAVSKAQAEMACAVPGYQESAASPSSYKLSLEDAALQKNVEEWFHVISERSPLDEKTVGVAVTINGRLEKIDWYGHAQVFHQLWPGLLRAAVLEALLEKRAEIKSPRPLDKARFRDLLHRLETVQPRKERPSPQTVDETWQFANCSVKRTGYLRSGTVAHVSISFDRSFFNVGWTASVLPNSYYKSTPTKIEDGTCHA
jgi:ARG and Rhodanese-Phosphatase-superfamily-associated Protein domain